MRGLRAILLLTALALPACSPAKPLVVAPASASARPDPRVSERLAEADAFVRAGCLDCLISSFNIYDGLRAVPEATSRATEGAIRTAILAGLRERELGIIESGYFERARQLAGGSDLLREMFLPLLDIADATPARTVGGAQAISDVQVSRRRLAAQNREAWPARLHPRIGDDLLPAYLWLGFNCSNVPATRQAVDGWMSDLAVWSGVPLIEWKGATCGSGTAGTFEQLLGADSRFVEIHYYLSLTATFLGKIDDAAAHLERAYEWRPRWPVVTNSLANLYFAVEDFEPAADFYARTLAIQAGDPDALLGKTRALFYLGRYRETLATVDELIALGRWHMGESRYWRAFAELQLDELDAAWADVEAAGTLWVNARVSKLAGIIAHRRGQLAVARTKFEESRRIDRLDCETGFYLGGVLGEQSAWAESATVLAETSGCLEDAERDLLANIDRIRQSEMPPERRARQIASRERQVTAGRRMMATTWFNLAAASFNLSRRDEARRWAERITADEEFGARARDLLSRLR